MSILHSLEALKDLAQESIDRSTDLVEGIHQIIEDTLTDATNTQDNAVVVAHRERVARVYDAIRAINHQLGQAASDAFEALENQGIALPKPASTKPEAASEQH